MKVIGTISRDRYICEVDHGELEKFFEKYYGHMKRLEVGQEVDLGAGYDHHAKIVSALHKTEEFIRGGQDIIKAITDGLVIAVRGSYPDQEKS